MQIVYERWIDFFALVLLLALVISAIYFYKNILFYDDTYAYTLTVYTEPMSFSHREKLAPGDTVYDNITKRAVGSIRECEPYGDCRAKLVLDMTATPHGNSLRTRSVWFYYESETADE